MIRRVYECRWQDSAPVDRTAAGRTTAPPKHPHSRFESRRFLMRYVKVCDAYQNRRYRRHPKIYKTTGWCRQARIKQLVRFIMQRGTIRREWRA